MLSGGLEGPDGRIRSWWLHDGKTATLLSEIRPEHRGLPVRISLMRKGLLNAIVNDWQPVDELNGVGLQKLVGPDVVLPRRDRDKGN